MSASHKKCGSSLLHRRDQCARIGRAFRRGSLTTYKEQGSVERGFRFLKDPLAPFLLRLPQEAGTDRRMKPDYGLVSVSLSVRRTSTTYTVSRKGASHSQRDSTSQPRLLPCGSCLSMF